MSLYFDAAAAIENADKVGGSLRSRIYGNKTVAKSTPAQIYALVTESSKWSPVLKEVVQKSQLLEHEKKLTPVLATLLVHDLLLAKRGIAAPRNHALYLAVSKHKARLGSEFTRIRLKRGYPTLELFQQAIEDGKLGGDSTNGTSIQTFRHPRWVRINRVQTSLETQLDTTFAKFKRVNDFKNILNASKSEQSSHLDQNIPDLLALPAGYDLSKSQAYLNGDIIVQDKASCFPAYLLDVERDNGDIIDACAAPGNKTTHLAAFVAMNSSSKSQRKVHAFEKDIGRTKILTKMIHKAGATSMVSVHGTTDFMTVDVNETVYQNVTSILLDPSCSGSGIVGRDDELSMELPEAKPAARPGSRLSKKRKRAIKDEGKDKKQQESTQDVVENDTEADDQSSIQRLEALSAFQSKLLQHAMSFPSATRIVYSTCSIHSAENESVVIRALSSPIGVDRGWKILPRVQHVPGVKIWNHRGDKDACSQALKSVDESIQEVLNANEIADACIRCEKNGESGTIGFFLAGFTRDTAAPKPNQNTSSNETELEQEDWNGCSDSE